MKRKDRRVIPIAFLLFSWLVLPGCRDGRTGDAVDFNRFVKTQIDNTAENTDPIEINNKPFRFRDDENAFDDILP